MEGIGRINIPGAIGPGSEVTVKGGAFDALLLWEPRAGGAVTVCSAEGALYRARVTGLNEGSAVLTVFEEAAPQDGPSIMLLQALPARERMELVIEKATELGVTIIQPFESSRSMTIEERDSCQKKSHRWQVRALKAARQSRRVDIPVVAECIDFERALGVSSVCKLKVLLSEAPDALPIREALTDWKAGASAPSVAIMTGPEGGLTPAEVELATGAGYVPANLGPRVLRTETASIIAVAAIGIVWCEPGRTKRTTETS